MHDTLLKLEAWIALHAPDAAEDFDDPAPPDALDSLQRAYDGRVPDDLLTLYTWHNGGELPDAHWTLSAVDEVLATKALHASMPDLHESPEWWSDSWIPIGADGDGNHLCVDLDGCFGGRPEQLLIFMHDERDRTIVAPSLADYVQSMLADCQAGEVLFDDDEGWVRHASNR